MPPLPQPLARFLLPGEGERPSKRDRTRRQLLHATVEVVASRGVAGTSIQEIARVAGMAPGTVYNHFSTREEIFEALAVALSTTLNERVVQSYQHIEDGAQRMSIGMRRFLWLAEESAPWALLLIQLASAYPEAIELIKPYSRADLRMAQAQGRFHVTDEEAAIDMVFGTCMRAQARIAQGEVPDSAAYVQALLQMVLRGLGMSPADAAEVMARPLPPFATHAPTEAAPAPRRAGARAGRAPGSSA